MSSVCHHSLFFMGNPIVLQGMEPLMTPHSTQRFFACVAPVASLMAPFSFPIGAHNTIRFASSQCIGLPFNRSRSQNLQIFQPAFRRESPAPPYCFVYQHLRPWPLTSCGYVWPNTFFIFMRNNHFDRQKLVYLQGDGSSVKFALVY